MLDQADRLRQLVNNPQAKKIKPKIMTITSGKGGVGKSNLVVNLAISLQKLGNKVLIFDADIGMGNDDILMGFTSKYNVFDIIYNDKSLDEVLIEGPCGVKLLPGGSGLNNVEELSDIQRERFLKKLDSVEDYNYILMDTGAGINRSVLAFIACAEELLVVTTPEPTSLTDAYSLLKAVNHFRIKKDAKIIVNRVVDKEEGKVTFEKFNGAVKKFLNMNLEHLGSVSEDKKLLLAVRQQDPIVISYPNSYAAKDIDSIAKVIMGKNYEADGEGMVGLFKRMFSIFS